MNAELLGKLKGFAELFKADTCIIAIDKLPDSGYGEIRIVTGNAGYLASCNHPVNANSPARNDSEFIPNQPYEHYIPKNLNFEDFCYRCAVLGHPLHSYIYLDHYNLWFEIFMMPIASEDDSIGYCTYTMELTKEVNIDKLTDISYKTSSEVLSACIKLKGAGDFKNAAHNVVCDIRKICKAAHCCILLTDTADRRCSVLAEDFAPVSPIFKPMKNYLDDDFYDMTLSWNDLIAESNCIIIKSKKDLELIKRRAPAWYHSLMFAGVESIVLFPLKTQRDTIGYIWALNFDVNNTLHIKQVLELTTFFIASEIAGYQMVNRLETLSRIDMLTGVNNRNSMNHHIVQFRWSKSLGVVFADLNGLKTINDRDGHFAGDLLLKKAAIALQHIFVGYDIYRSGGDEFVVIAQDISREELERCIEHLRNISETPDMPCFAVGSVFSDQECDIHKMLQIADERMYNDKAKYYQCHPEISKR